MAGPPKKKSAGKGKTTEATTNTVTESDVAIKPTMDLPALNEDKEVDDLPDFDADPSQPAGNSMNLDDLPDLPAGGQPTLAQLNADIHKMTGGGSAATGGLADAFLPILSTKFDQLQDKVVGQFETLRTGIDAQLQSALKPVLDLVSKQSKLIQALAGELHEQMLPAITRIDGVLAAWSDEEDGEEGAEAVVEAQESRAAEPKTSVPTQTKVTAPEVSDALKNIVTKYAGHFKAQGNAPRPASQFIEAVLKKHAKDLDPAKDTTGTVTAYLTSLGAVKDGQLQFP